MPSQWQTDKKIMQVLVKLLISESVAWLLSIFPLLNFHYSMNKWMGGGNKCTDELQSSTATWQDIKLVWIADDGSLHHLCCHYSKSRLHIEHSRAVLPSQQRIFMINPIWTICSTGSACICVGWSLFSSTQLLNCFMTFTGRLYFWIQALETMRGCSYWFLSLLL